MVDRRPARPQPDQFTIPFAEFEGKRRPFTPQLKEVLQNAGEAALKFGHRFIGTEHLLLGAMQDKRLEKFWEEVGLTTQTVEEQVAPLAWRGREIPEGQIIFTRKAKTAIAIAKREAAIEGNPRVDSDHLLIGISGQGFGSDIIETTITEEEFDKKAFSLREILRKNESEEAFRQGLPIPLARVIEDLVNSEVDEQYNQVLMSSEVPFEIRLQLLKELNGLRERTLQKMNALTEKDTDEQAVKKRPEQKPGAEFAAIIFGIGKMVFDHEVDLFAPLEDDIHETWTGASGRDYEVTIEIEDGVRRIVFISENESWRSCYAIKTKEERQKNPYDGRNYLMYVRLENGSPVEYGDFNLGQNRRDMSRINPGLKIVDVSERFERMITDLSS